MGEMIGMLNKIKGGLFGLCVGDALGVPVEFYRREERIKDPVKEMRGYGTYNQPPGTWSDDSSLALCLAESLTRGLDLNDIAENFIKWETGEEFTPHGYVFDIGYTTRTAITNLKGGVSPEHSGVKNSRSNGSLMRILPIAFYLKGRDMEERVRTTSEVASITHSHPLPVDSCVLYVEFLVNLLEGKGRGESYDAMASLLDSDYVSEVYRRDFSWIKDGTPYSKDYESLVSDGSALRTLESALWCFLNTSSYKDSVLAAVNIGGDTDTTAAVAGGMGGIFYGYKNIPEEWIDQLARKEFIEKISCTLYEKYK